ncbi:MAG: hypothetical protein PHN18_06420 [Sulfurospirillaceae bacterium]|nr:hypothetical protein [Sulfurospirillaceae bacterium]MDD2825949.1 hypothetical protein [Sulfurospirillaceae bacterium]
MAENSLTIQQYASKHKISAFAVIKLINTKKIKTIKKTVDGEEKEFILDDTVAPTLLPKNEAIQENATTINYEIEFHKLLAKHLELQAKYDAIIEAKRL